MNFLVELSDQLPSLTAGPGARTVYDPCAAGKKILN